MPTFNLLNLPENFKVTVIPSGCCGMAGSFGYEKEHYDISMQMGNLTLFPAIKKADADVIIAATGNELPSPNLRRHTTHGATSGKYFTGSSQVKYEVLLDFLTVIKKIKH